VVDEKKEKAAQAIKLNNINLEE